MSRSRDLSKGTTRTEFVFTATDGQTTFSTDDTSTALAYTAGKIDVYLNGVRLAPADFTATNGTSIVLASGAAAGDFLEVLIFTATDLSTSGAGGRYKGERGTVGAAGNAGDIFRVHEKQLDTDVTIAATENALAAGPLAVASGKTLTITTGGNLSIV